MFEYDVILAVMRLEPGEENSSVGFPINKRVRSVTELLVHKVKFELNFFNLRSLQFELSLIAPFQIHRSLPKYPSKSSHLVHELDQR